MKAYTDYPFTPLGDIAGKEAPIREIDVLSYDGDKYCDIEVFGKKYSIKSGYIYSKPGRYGDVPRITKEDLKRLEGADNEQLNARVKELETAILKYMKVANSDIFSGDRVDEFINWCN